MGVTFQKLGIDIDVCPFKYIKKMNSGQDSFSKQKNSFNEFNYISIRFNLFSIN